MKRGTGLIKIIAVFALGAATAIVSPAQTFSSLFSFDVTDGQWPIYSGALVQGFNGNLYGTTVNGGTDGCGTIFEISRAGQRTTLHNFHTNSDEGCTPYAGLALAANGNFYGVTPSGGATLYGTAFEITPAGEFTVIHTFCVKANCTDGSGPSGPLMQAANGELYGTTAGGGANSEGTVFKIGSTFSTVYSFCSLANCADGKVPVSGLVQGSNGNFYGTTSGGGTGTGEVDGNTGGTVFQLTPEGVLTTLYSFCSQANCTDGLTPSAGLARGGGGTFYGTTYAGGAVAFGTVYKITEGGSFQSLYSFCTDGCGTGADSRSALVRGTDGNFYGTSSEGGSGAYAGGTLGGTVFQITPEGAFTLLYSFCSQSNCTDGTNPNAGLVQATDGNFYGTTYEGGTDEPAGTVFKLATGLHHFVETLPSSGAEGRSVTILGTNLTGATAVTFNGISAVFTVVSATEITTTVPSGATSGTVEVVVPAGTLKSNASFIVP